MRQATQSDLPQVRQIFNHYVLNTVVSFLVQPPPPDYIRSRFESSLERNLPYLVAVDSSDGGETVVGYAYASAFRGFMLGYAHTVEMSIFCHPKHISRGIGSQLMVELLTQLRTTKHMTKEAGYEDKPIQVDVKKVMAIMAVDEQAPSNGLALCEWYQKWGFEEVGRLKGVGYKKGRV